MLRCFVDDCKDSRMEGASDLRRQGDRFHVSSRRVNIEFVSVRYRRTMSCALREQAKRALDAQRRYS
jgi:hypothetical protein